jgi:hypothetical protein
MMNFSLDMICVNDVFQVIRKKKYIVLQLFQFTTFKVQLKILIIIIRSNTRGITSVLKMDSLAQGCCGWRCLGKMCCFGGLHVNSPRVYVLSRTLSREMRRIGLKLKLDHRANEQHLQYRAFYICKVGLDALHEGFGAC